MRCGKPIKDEYKEYCSDCAKRTSHITQGRSLWLHKEPVSTAIYKFKYNNKRSWGELFAAEMAQAYKDQVIKWGIEEIIPIPLHKSRKRKRGYNQAEIIAKCLSEKTGVSLVSDALFRVKKTTAQKKLDRQGTNGKSKGCICFVRKMETCGECASDRRYLYNGSDSRAGSKNIKKGRGAKCVLFDYKHWTRYLNI